MLWASLFFIVEVQYKSRISLLPCSTYNLVRLVDCEGGAARIDEAPDLVSTLEWVARSGVEGAGEVRGVLQQHPQEVLIVSNLLII